MLRCAVAGRSTKVNSRRNVASRLANQCACASTAAGNTIHSARLSRLKKLISGTDPAINFLRRDKRAEWIVFPAAVDAYVDWFAGLESTLRRACGWVDVPDSAHLSS